MDVGQYRALVAYLNYWPDVWEAFTFEGALNDTGIELDKEDVIDRLWKAGHGWDEDTNTLTYEE